VGVAASKPFAACLQSNFVRIGSMMTSMEPMRVVAALMVFNVLALSLVASWYVAPGLASLPRERALIPVILVHLIRPISLWTLVPGVIVSADMPQAWARSTAIGDVLATALALAAAFALRCRARWALGLVWAFNIVGLADAIKNGIFAAHARVIPHMGAAALVPSYGVPLLLVSHGLVFWLLLRPASRAGSPPVPT